MNICVEGHKPKYQITYKPAPGGSYVPKWLVCENCMDNRKCFGSEELIETEEIIA